VRLRPYVERRFGEPRPKQYCTFAGGRSMLHHTLDRAAALASAERTVTVAAAAHERWARPQLCDHPGTVVYQTANRETGPGLYLPLCWVKARDPAAIVYILPSDHFVRPRDRFVDAVAAAGDVAARHRDRIVLTAVAADAPDPSYGYLEPGGPVDGPARAVARFVEKPSRDDAAAAIGRGAAWSTMVVAASVDALWAAGCATIPEAMGLFDELVDAVDTPFEPSTLAAIYLGMPCASFSRDVLERVADRCLMVQLDGIEWSDWGDADRIEASLGRRGPRRAAPVAAAADGLVAAS
jgi:mannose-1-phosphate guanylyltransferase